MEMDKNPEKFITDKAQELIRKHKKYIGEDVAEKAIEKLEDEKNSPKSKNKKSEEKKEENEDGIVQEKAKRGRPRRKA